MATRIQEGYVIFPSMLAFLAFAMVFPSIAVFSYFHFASSPEATRFWYGASKVLQFSLPLVSIFLFRRPLLWNLKAQRQDIALGLLTGLATFGGLIALYWLFMRHLPFLPETKLAIQEKLFQFGADTPLRFALLALFISVAHSFLEEYFWRGFVFLEMERRLPAGWALPLSALAFTGHHVVVIDAYSPKSLAWLLVPIFSIFVFVGGMLWAMLARRSGTLLGAWISHFLADVALMLIGAHLVFG